MNSAPVALFCYNRPPHFMETVTALQRNHLAQETELFIFSDGPRATSDSEAVRQVRSLARAVTGFKTVRLVERDSNLGLAKSLISGVTELVEQYGRIIVLEDDLVTSPHFLTYVNEALEIYKDVDNVASIHGYIYPVSGSLPETFFIRGADCWGWATWSRAWRCFEPRGSVLLNQLKARNLTREFDYSGTYPFTQMLEDHLAGGNNSWAIRWYASAFLADKVTLYPGRSLVRNIGWDNSGTHCSETNTFDVDVAIETVHVQRLEARENISARQRIVEYFEAVHRVPFLGRSSWSRISHKLRPLFRA